MDFNKVCLVVIPLLCCVVLCTGQGICTGFTPCYCKFENGQFLHLTGLARTDGMPRFVNVSDKHEMVYSWNPCFNFTEEGCHEVAVCGIQPSLPHDLYLPLGYQNMTTFTTNKTDNSVTLMYKTPGNPLRTSYVALICTKGDAKDSYLKAIGQKHQLSTDFFFELRSPFACPQGDPITTTIPAPAKNPVNSKLEAATIAVSVLAFVLLVALVIVVLKMKGKICNGNENYEDL